ncbi:MAG: glycoside hydrolase family 3 C-terminal domain-containing protein [Fimbriimonadaceae bacterium]|nr:glycoside hydrolase family 3 C-terminal domain-containing protein [Fimbriimonadaceae bacterium]
MMLPALCLTLQSPAYLDFNKNGRMDLYENPRASVERRIEDLLRQMTLEEKTCQLATLYGYKAVLKDMLPTPEWDKEIWKDGIANIDEQLNSFRIETKHDWPPAAHVEAINTIQRWFVEHTRLGIPVDFSNEGIRGIMVSRATSFPSQTGLGASWDRSLVRQVGEVTGSEARSYGFTNIYSPILDTARDPRWGRTEECYGESPYLVAELGIQQTLGIQSQRVVSTPKHYTVYGANKGAREGDSRTDPQIPRREAEDEQIYPFQRVFEEAGALGVMSSYNDYDGIPITGSEYWLTTRLRKDFGFKGYVVSDSDAVEFLASKHRVAKDYKEAVRQTVTAGLNVRTTFTPPQDYILPLRELVREGKVPMRVIDDRVRDVLRVKFWLGLFDDPYFKDTGVVMSPEHREIGLRAARESLVLLKNDKNLLPLPKTLKRIAVIGPNADDKALARKQYGPLRVEVTSVLEGIQAKVGTSTEIHYARGCAGIDSRFPDNELVWEPPIPKEQAEMDEAVAVARSADAVVLVMGDSTRTTGESRSRTSLDLPGRQEDLVRAIAATGKPVVLVLLNGRPMTINYAARNVPAILVGWIPGAQTGTAVAEALFGDINPGGKLPNTWPKTVGQVPYNFPSKPNANDDPMRSYSAHNGGVLWPFGFGLSYTTFRYSNLAFSHEVRMPATVEVSCEIENVGERAGEEVAQLYLHDRVSSVTTYDRALRGFERVSLAPGEKKTVKFSLVPDRLALWDRRMRRVVEPGDFDIWIGSSSETILLKGVLRVTGSTPYVIRTMPKGEQ